ncbi:hypothetical protein GE061_005735 [Apolygus lucorum]|uniref:Uncharacterized protein n=1 Tax=Apolygus lucorum TaxID=248454 RepID=A0A6A4ILH8_APOLU|nr:hypothetical protein GE061_005735 [Apolygus lucorum]
MNLHEINQVPTCTNFPAQTTQKTTTFLTTHLPLAVESLTKTTNHASATVSQRSFGPNDCILMTTWLEKFTYSTFKSTAVGNPVVSDSVQVPPHFLGATCRPQQSQGNQDSDKLQPSSSWCTSNLTSAPCTSSDSATTPCTSTSNSTPTCPSYDNPSKLEDELMEMAAASEDEMCTDSEDEVEDEV